MMCEIRGILAIVNTIECWQAASVAFDRWVCNGEAGRSKTDPVYQAVVEGRDNPRTYKTFSSCAERPMAKLWRFGCRRAFVNREERTPAPNDWKSGVNISNLHDLAKGSPCLFQVDAKGKKHAAAPGLLWIPSIGDELLIWNHPLGKDAHSLSIVTFDGGLATTGNYGSSGMSDAVFPGAKLSDPTPLEFRSGGWWCGKTGKQKRVMRVLPLVDYVTTFTEKPNFDGIPFDHRFTGEVLEHLQSLVVS